MQRLQRVGAKPVFAAAIVGLPQKGVLQIGIPAAMRAILAAALSAIVVIFAGAEAGESNEFRGAGYGPFSFDGHP